MKRQIIIGDIHGCFDELQKLLDKVGVNKDDEIISAGDFIDRGPKSLEVVEFIRNNDNVIAIAGNHERKHLNKIFTYAQEITKIQLGNIYDETIKWIEKLPYFYESDNVIVVHAALIPGLELERQPVEVLCGSSSGQRYLDEIFEKNKWYELYNGDKPIVFGHHCVGDSIFIYKDKIYGIDTGACHGGYLTAITIPDFKVYSVKAKDDYWEIEKRKWQKQVIIERPWKTMKWEYLQKEIKRLRNLNNEKEIINYISLIETWAEKTKMIIPKMLECIENTTRKIIEDVGEPGFNEYAKKHVLNQYLFTCYHGRLTIDVLLKKCTSPQETIKLSKQLGIKVEEIPDGIKD